MDHPRLHHKCPSTDLPPEIYPKSQSKATNEKSPKNTKKIEKKKKTAGGRWMTAGLRLPLVQAPPYRRGHGAAVTSAGGRTVTGDWDGGATSVGSGEAAPQRRGRAAAAAQEEEEGYVARVLQVLEGSSIYTEWAQHRPSNCKSTGRDDWAGWAVYSLRENSLDARFLARLLLFLHFSTN